MKRFSGWLFFQKWCQMEPKLASKMSQNLIKNELETKSTKHVGNVPNLRPSGLQETRFRMERLSKITKTRGADKYKTISKNCVEMKPKSMENRSRTQQKTTLKNRCQHIKTNSKKRPPIRAQQIRIFRGCASWGTFWSPKPLLGIKN